MDARSAAQMVNSLSCRPGYEIRASAFSPYEMMVEVNVTTVDTNEPPNYPTRIKTGDFRIVDTSNIYDEKDIAGIVHQLVMDIESHEWREFLAFKQASGKWVAPLHPHTQEGNENYNLVQAKPYQMYY